jgi:hypothetical protein
VSHKDIYIEPGMGLVVYRKRDYSQVVAKGVRVGGRVFVYFIILLLDLLFLNPNRESLIRELHNYACKKKGHTSTGRVGVFSTYGKLSRRQS